LGHIYIMSTDP